MNVTRARSDEKIHPMTTSTKLQSTSLGSTPIDSPEGAASGPGSLRLVPSSVWVALLAVLAAFLAIAAVENRQSRFIVMVVVGLCVVVAIARLIGSEVARQKRAALAAERQAAEFERLTQVR